MPAGGLPSKGLIKGRKLLPAEMAKLKNGPLRSCQYPPYDAMVEAIQSGKPSSADIVTLEQAAWDVKLLRQAEQQPGVCFTV